MGALEWGPYLSSWRPSCVSCDSAKRILLLFSCEQILNAISKGKRNLPPPLTPPLHS